MFQSNLRVCIFGSEIGSVKKGVFVGGSTVSAVRLGKALHDMGDEVFVLSSSPRGYPSGFYSFEWGSILNKRIPARYSSFPYLILYGFWSFFSLLKFCRKNRVNIINSHAGSFFLCVIPSMVGKILRIPVVHTQYCELNFLKIGTRGAVIASLATILSKLVNKFCGISFNVCDSLIEASIPIQKIVKVPPVVPFKKSGNIPVPKQFSFLKSFRGEFKILYVGNLRKNKGLDVLIEAFVSLSQKYPSMRLIITTELEHQGFSERKKKIQHMLENRDLVGRVTWLGIVDNIVGLIGEVDVVVIPFLDLKGISDYPLVMLEAIRAGTPVIASDIGGTSEVIGRDSGILVPPGDVDALFRALKSVFFGVPTNKHKDLLEMLPLLGFDSISIGKEYQSLFLNELNSQ